MKDKYVDSKQQTPKFVDRETLNIDTWDKGRNKFKINYKGLPPVIDKETLNGQFLKGNRDLPSQPFGMNDDYFIKNLMRLTYGIDEVEMVIMEKWNYTFPKELDITKYILEKMLLDNGTIAFCKIAGKYIFQPYEIVGEFTDIYGRPEKIKINNEKAGYNNVEVDKGNFILIYDTMTGDTLYNRMSVDIQDYNNVLLEMSHNLYISKGKIIILNVEGADDDVSVSIAESFNDMGESPQFAYVMNMTQKQYSELLKRLNGKGDIKLSDIFLPVQMEDRTEKLIQQALFWKNIIKEKIGLEVDFDLDKVQRKITDEMSAQQGENAHLGEHRFNIRQLAMEQIKEKFGIEIKIELNEIKEQQIDKGEKDNETPTTL